MRDDSTLIRERDALIQSLMENISVTEDLAKGPEKSSSDERKTWIERVKTAIDERQATVDRLATVDAELATNGEGGGEARRALEQVIRTDRLLLERFVGELREIQRELGQVRTSRAAVRAYAASANDAEPLFRRAL